MIAIAIADDRRGGRREHARLRQAVRRVLADAGITQARISVAIVDDPTIHELNRRYLRHDYATDVLSFLLADGDCLEGEIVASADTAATMAAQWGWPAADELLLYVIHGALHLVGEDDQSAGARRRMQAREAHYLGLMGLTPPAKPPGGGPRRRKAVAR